MQDLEVFNQLCKDVNEGFTAMTFLFEIVKSDSDDLINVIKEQENGNG